MTEVNATSAARNFAELLDAVEHRGERFTIVRRGKVIAQLELGAEAGQLAGLTGAAQRAAEHQVKPL